MYSHPKENAQLPHRRAQQDVEHHHQILSESNASGTFMMSLNQEMWSVCNISEAAPRVRQPYPCSLHRSQRESDMKKRKTKRVALPWHAGALPNLYHSKYPRNIKAGNWGAFTCLRPWGSYAFMYTCAEKKNVRLATRNTDTTNAGVW